MQCTKPKLLSVKGYFPGLYVPCGKCMSCRVSRAREWSVRIMHEVGYHVEGSSFVTLTYSNEHLSLDGSLSKSDLQRFFKRLRKALDGRRIKYYACGEYGEETGRPHYHAIIFGLGRGVRDQKKLYNCWPFGNVFCGSVTYNSARYVADYIGKKLDGPLGEIAYKNKEPPFQLFSKGLGKQWAMDNSEYVTRRLGVTLNGKEVGLPRYYKKILDIPKEALIEKAKEHEKNVEDYHKKRPVKKVRYKVSDLAVAAADEKISHPVYENWETIDIPGSLAKSRQQADKNIQARHALRRKKL